MGMQLRSWWQKIKQHWVAIVVGAIVLVVIIVLIVVGYSFDWTGFLRKTLWDWLQLLNIPLVLAVIALLFNLANSRTERQIAPDNQRETAL
jgi:fumarate reductase subunit C